MTCVIADCDGPRHRGGFCVECYREIVGPPFACACGANYQSQRVADKCCTDMATGINGEVRARGD